MISISKWYQFQNDINFKMISISKWYKFIKLVWILTLFAKSVMPKTTHKSADKHHAIYTLLIIGILS